MLVINFLLHFKSVALFDKSMENLSKIVIFLFKYSVSQRDFER